VCHDYADTHVRHSWDYVQHTGIGGRAGIDLITKTILEKMFPCKCHLEYTPGTSIWRFSFTFDEKTKPKTRKRLKKD
jgi:hypothetical protein